MPRHRLAAAVLAMLAMLALPAAASAVTVTPAAPNGVTSDGQATGSLTFEAPPQAAEGLGATSARLRTGAGGWDPTNTSGAATRGGIQRLYAPEYAGASPADLDALRYSTYKASTTDGAVTTPLKLELDFNGPAAGGFTTLTFEPIYNTGQGAIQSGAWQEWDAIDGGEAQWWSSRDLGKTGFCANDCRFDWDDFVAEFPAAVIGARGVQLVAGQNGTGAPWQGFDAYVDGLEVTKDGAAKTFDFEDDGGTTLPVGADGSRMWRQISLAVNSAQAGDTIDVAAGTYTDQVVLDRTLTLRGAGRDQTTIQPPVLLQAPFAGDTASRKPVVAVPAAGTGSTIDDLTVDGAGRGNANTIFYGIAALDAALTVDDARVRNVRNTPLDGLQGGNAIYARRDAAGLRPATITDTEVTGYQKNGITLHGPYQSIVARNTVTGSGPTGAIAQNGIQLSGGARGSVVENVVTGNACDPPACAADTATGVLLSGAGSVFAAGNELSGNDNGLYAVSSSSVVQARQNRVTGNRADGLILYGLPAVASGNTVTGNKTGIFASDGSQSILANRITGNVTGLETWDDPAIEATSSISAGDNWWGSNAGPVGTDVVNDSTTATTASHLVLETASAAGPLEVGGATRGVAARMRSTEAATPPEVLDLFPRTPVAFAGLGGTVVPATADLAGDDDATTTFASGTSVVPLAGVTATLDDETVTQAITLSDDGVTLVDDSDTVSDVLGCGAAANLCDTIQKAVDVTPAGGTVDVAAGSYPETVSTDKALTLRGARAADDARDRDADTADESVVNRFALGAQTTLDGFWVERPTPSVAHLATVSGGSGHTIEDNVLKGGNIGLDLQSPGTGTTVRRNAFADNASTDGNGSHGLWSHPSTRSSGLEISDNEFSGHAHPGGNASGINLSNADGATIDGNETATEPGSFLVVSRTDDLTVSGNDLDSTGGTALFLGGDNDGTSILGNVFRPNPGSTRNQIRVADSFVDGDPNTGLEVLGNTITGRERGLVVDDDGHDGTVEAHFNRFASNRVAAISTGTVPVDAENNWWGCNGGPGAPGCDAVVGAPQVDADPRLVLGVSASPASIATGGRTSVITATLQRNSAGQTPTGNVLPASPVAFTTNLGSLAPATDEASGTEDATTTLTSGAAAGTARPAAELDGQRVNAVVRFGDADGDGLIDAADCAPNDATRPFRPQGQDLDCNGVKDPVPGNGNNNNGNGNGKPSEGETPNVDPPITFGVLEQRVEALLGGNAQQVSQLQGLGPVGAAFFRRGSGQRLTLGRSNVLTLFGVGCTTACTIDTGPMLTFGRPASGATAAQRREPKRYRLKKKRYLLVRGGATVVRVRVTKKLRRRVNRSKRSYLTVAVKVTNADGKTARDLATYRLRVRKQR